MQQPTDRELQSIRRTESACFNKGYDNRHGENSTARSGGVWDAEEDELGLQ